MSLACRITREAQAMGRLGSSPHIVTVFDLGEHEGQPYIVTELMSGGDVEEVPLSTHWERGSSPSKNGPTIAIADVRHEPHFVRLASHEGHRS